MRSIKTKIICKGQFLKDQNPTDYTEGQLNWKSDSYLLRHPIQRSDLIDGIENSIKARNKMAAVLTCLHLVHITCNP